MSGNKAIQTLEDELLQDLSEEDRELAMEIKYSYIGVMRTLRGSPNYGTVKNENGRIVAIPLRKLVTVLPQAVKYCREAGVSGERYVMAQHQFFTLDHLYPSQLITANAVANVEAYKRLTLDPVRFPNIMQVQLQYLMTALRDKTRTVDDVLMNDYIHLYAWFRIIITLHPNPRVIEKYLTKAREEVTLDLIEFLKTQKYKDGRYFDVGRITGYQ